MKPFDLEAAKRGEPIVTRDGRKATYVGYAPKANKSYRVVVHIEGDAFPAAYDDAGNAWRSDPRFDLFMALRKRTVYMNIYTLGHACWHGDEEVARRNAKNPLVTAMPIEIEE